MEQNDAILTFDTLYTTNEIQILKLALPLLSPSLRPYAALLIKGKELKYCMEQLPQKKIEHASLELSHLDAFLESALPYCTEKQANFIHRIKNLKHGIDMFEKMQGMMSMFGEDDISDISNLFNAFGQPANPQQDSIFPDDMLCSFMSGEQSEMFEQFKKKFEEEL